MNAKKPIYPGDARRFEYAAGTPASFGGFTLIEVMIVIAVIAILAAIAVPSFISYRQRGYDSMARSDARNSYYAARAYFDDFPAKVLSNVAELDYYGFRNTEGVALTVTGNAATLVITATHPNGTRTFTIDAGGKLGS